jgi:hypothetical protein
MKNKRPIYKMLAIAAVESEQVLSNVCAKLSSAT